jgi:hypothetical protein
MSYPAAPTSLADHMLHPADLGAGWYQGTTPAVITVKANLPTGASEQAQTLLSAMHRTGRQWEMDGGVSERAFSFRQPAAARRYVTSWLRTQTGPQAVGFVVGSTAYILNYDVNVAAHAPVLSKAKVVTIAKSLARIPVEADS